MKLAARVADALERLDVASDARIAVACSGGADSIALVHLIRGGRDVVVLHVDHQLRPSSADDVRFVERTADRLGLDFRSQAVSVDAARGGSLEAAARDVRYAALEAMAREAGVAHVLTAHTRDDQAETVLLRLMRGDTLDGIAPIRGVFLRPLLDVARSELREWLAARDVEWREDPTNADTRFERNWVRRDVLPLLARRRPGVASVLARAAQRAAADGRALDAMADDVLEDADVDDVGIFIPRLDDLPEAITSRVVRRACRCLDVDPRAAEVDAVVRSRSAHVRVREVDAWRIDDGIAFIRSPMRTPARIAIDARRFASREWGVTFRTSRPGLEIRSRRPGDRIATRAGTRKVQDILVDAKVPRPLRALVPIVAEVADGAIAMVGASMATPASGTVFDVEPFEQTWSRKRAWINR